MVFLHTSARQTLQLQLVLSTHIMLQCVLMPRLQRKQSVASGLTRMPGNVMYEMSAFTGVDRPSPSEWAYSCRRCGNGRVSATHSGRIVHAHRHHQGASAGVRVCVRASLHGTINYQGGIVSESVHSSCTPRRLRLAQCLQRRASPFIHAERTANRSICRTSARHGLDLRGI